MANTIYAKPVEVLHCPVGNLWDIFVDCVFYARVTYHGDRLVRVKSKPRGVVSSAPSTSEIEDAIAYCYRDFSLIV
jgi:hypothetical protein